MNTAWRDEELFTLPWQEQFIVYAPLRRLAFLVTPGLARILERWRSVGDEALDGAEAREAAEFFTRVAAAGARVEFPVRDPGRPFAPTYVTLFLTTRCNLRCRYCYARGGESPLREISMAACDAAVNLVSANAARGRNEFSVGFHGGGEPALAWKTLTAVVERARALARSRGQRARFQIATNGLLTGKQLDWIMDRFDGMTVSLDGPPDIHDAQRPRSDGRGSHAAVMRTLARLDGRGFAYGIRATITAASVDRLTEIVNFVTTRTRCRNLQLEPVFLCGRCDDARVEAAPVDRFVERFQAASLAAEARGLRIHYSGLRLDLLTPQFCQACGDSFCVTPEGDVTSCYEVSSPDDPRAAAFFFGRFVPERPMFEFDPDRLAGLRGRTVDRVSHCRDCFCKYHCAGDCPAKASPASDLTDFIDSGRCTINRELQWRRLGRILDPAGPTMKACSSDHGPERPERGS